MSGGEGEGQEQGEGTTAEGWGVGGEGERVTIQNVESQYKNMYNTRSAQCKGCVGSISLSAPPSLFLSLSTHTHTSV